MDVIESLRSSKQEPINCVEMHTCGEPTRIVVKGYPNITGTLLEQRALAKQEHDHIRKQLMLEPRGHADMYGAILRPVTELTKTGKAHMGVLFTHNEGYSTMCGHATIALGRFLVDTLDKEVFPLRDQVRVDEETLTALVKIHAPCGLVEITVPVRKDLKSDSSRPVSFISVPSFQTALDLSISIPPRYQWPELGNRQNVVVDICFGGAFTCLIRDEQLGFSGGRTGVNLGAITRAANLLKQAIISNPDYKEYFKHPEQEELGSLYTTVVVNKDLGKPASGSKGVETGICFFADQQIDRSPTGSAVAARVAVAYAKGELGLGQSWTYHSWVSNAMNGEGGFVGTPVEAWETTKISGSLLRVEVEGFAYYTGHHTFVVEDGDTLGRNGFLFAGL